MSRPNASVVELNELEREHFKKMDEKELEEKKNFYSSNLTRKATEIFFLYSSIAVSNKVNWKLLESETGEQAVARYLEKHPEDREMYQRLSKQNEKKSDLNLIAVIDSNNKSNMMESLLMDQQPQQPQTIIMPEGLGPLPQDEEEDEPSDHEHEFEDKKQSLFASTQPSVTPTPTSHSLSPKTPLTAVSEPRSGSITIPLMENFHMRTPTPTPTPTNAAAATTATTTATATPASATVISREEIQKMIQDSFSPFIQKSLCEIMPIIQETIIQKVTNLLDPLAQQMKLLNEKCTQLEKAKKQEVEAAATVVSPPQDPYVEDKHRTWDFVLKKSAAEGFQLPETYNPDTASLYDKAVLRARTDALEKEATFITNQERLVIGVGYGVEQFAKCFGLGTEALNGFGSSVEQFVNEEQGLRSALRYMYREEGNQGITNPKTSLVSSGLGLILGTLCKNETPYVAAALQQGMKDIKTMVTPAREDAEAKKKKRMVKKKMKNIGKHLVRDVVTINDDDNEEDKDDKKQTFERDSDDEIREKINTRYTRAGFRPPPPGFSAPIGENADEFIRENKSRMRKRATTEKAKEIFAEAPTQTQQRNFSFREPEPGEKPKLQAVNALPIHNMIDKLAGQDGLMEGYIKASQAIENNKQKNKEQTETLKQVAAEIYNK